MTNDNVAGWYRDALSTARRWCTTLYVTFAAPERLWLEQGEAGRVNSPLRQLLGAIFLTILFQELAGLDLAPIDKDLELPPVLAGLSAALRRVPGSDILLNAALYGAAALPIWLMWRSFDHRASLKIIYSAQLYLASVTLCLLMVFAVIRGGLFASGTGILLEAVAATWAVAFILWSAAWLIWQVPRQANASRLKFSLALLATALVLGALQAFSPIPWRPRTDFSIPAASMEPTMVEGHQVSANMWVYAFRSPRRGEVLIFEREGVRYVSRLVGLPGDTVEIRGGRVALNGEYLKRQVVSLPRSPNEDREVELSIERTPGGAAYMVQDYGTEMDGDEFGPMKIPAGQYFLMGDNRDNSFDSRFEGMGGPSGLVGRGEVRGRVYRIVFPLGRKLDQLPSLDEERGASSK